MPTNADLKRRIRDYADLHDVPYAEARTRVLAAQETGLAGVVYTVQMESYPDGVLPYPFHVGATDGLIGRQDFWRGRVNALVGFSATPEAGEVDLEFDDWLNHVQAAVGMYPVTSDSDLQFATHTSPVTQVIEHRHRAD